MRNAISETHYAKFVYLNMSKKINNPFLVSGYVSPTYFCDRDEETADLVEAFENGRNTVLYSPRRLGKTGLLKHVLYKLKQKKVITLYLDIYATLTLEDFVTELANAIARTLSKQRKSILNTLKQIFKSVRPTVTFDELNGHPIIELTLITPEATKATLNELFAYLDGLKQPVVIAIDEFQQVNNYDNDQQAEALIRSKIQHLHNIRFIFSGSHQHMLLSMFGNRSRPFYQSAQLIQLARISEKDYTKFIVKHLKRGGIKLDPEDIAYVLNWTHRHTYYTQYVFNRIYSQHQTSMSTAQIKLLLSDILMENAAVYFNYRSLLTRHQWKVLRAIAKEDLVLEPYSKDFLHKHKLGAVSSVSRSIKALLKSEMIYEVYDEIREKEVLLVYDVFFKQWLKHHA